MSYHPRIETTEYASFLTTRTQASELWFVNTPVLEQAILGYTAKYQARYGVKLYAIAIEGNHVQGPADFPGENRADFMRDLNSSIARAVPRYVENYRGGRLWARRYSVEYLPGPEDTEDRFFYTVLQQVQDGIAPRISDCLGYNCFYDAVRGIKRKFKVVNWAKYNAAKRYNPNVRIKDYTETVELEFARLPGYEHLSQREYAKLMHKKLEERRVEIVKERLAEGKGYPDKETLRQIKPGSVPRSTKTSTETSHRPRILSVYDESRATGKAWYFSIYDEYKIASARYRAGELDVKFPRGTYPPPKCCVRAQAPP